jgi:tryptophanyl-tRNA synthetase
VSESKQTDRKRAPRRRLALKGVVFSGSRPTGRLHLGNLEGALRNWVALQDEYVAYYGIVDLHALTTDYGETEHLQETIFQFVLDFLAAGVDPGKSTILVQSRVPQHAELHTLLSMITPVSWLERVPTYKEKVEDLGGTPPCYGLLGYPVLQTADILLYKADTVPVGKDQLPHLELAREIARRFNSLYGRVFPEPEALVTEVPVLPGIDGRKMSKSYGNTIDISDPPDLIRRKVRSMFTDPRRIYRTDPGHPEECPVYFYHRVYTPDEHLEVARQCRAAEIGCVDCKAKLAENIIKALAPIQQKRAELEKQPDLVRDILNEGCRKARQVAAKTMAEVKGAMKL